MPDPYAAPATAATGRRPGAGGLPRLLGRFRTLGAPEQLLADVAEDWEQIDATERRRWVNAPDGALMREIEAHRTDPEHVPDPDAPEPDPEPQGPIIGAADDYAGVPTYAEAQAAAAAEPEADERMAGWPYPDGNVQAVLDWVGDDTWKAEQALLAEGARDAGPRSTVTTVLDRMLERAEG